MVAAASFRTARAHTPAVDKVYGVIADAVVWAGVRRNRVLANPAPDYRVVETGPVIIHPYAKKAHFFFAALLHGTTSFFKELYFNISI
jgi:hypothetical protein